MRLFPMKRSFHWLASGLVVLCAGAGAQERPPTLRQSFDISVPQAPTPMAVQGLIQLTYELHLTNFSSDTLSVKRVRVVDPAGRMLADVAGDALDRRLALVSGQKGAIAPGQRAVLFVETDVSAAPGALRHIVDYGVAGNDAVFTTESGALKIGTAPPVLLG